jgi:hypothetical protein
MIVPTPQGLREFKRGDYANDRDFYRAIVLARFGVLLSSRPFGDVLS